MSPRVCPSCEHEVHDDQGGMCPFCGTELRRGLVRSGSGKNLRIVLAMGVLVLMLAGGMVTFLLAGQSAERERAEVVRTVQPAPAGEEVCIGNMERIFRVQRDFRVEHGRFSGDEKALSGLADDLEFSCPLTGEAYRMEVDERTVRLICPTHGTRSI